MAIDITITSSQIQQGLEDIVKRTNEQILFMNSLPREIRAQMNMQVYDDIEYLLKYIHALHGVLEEVTVEEKKTFDF